MPPSSSAANEQLATRYIQPGRPNTCLQSFAAFPFRHKRYVAYITGQDVIILSSTAQVLQVIPFQSPLHAISAHESNGKLVVAEDKSVYLLEPVIESWTRTVWEKTVILSRKQADGAARTLSWTKEGEILVGGSKCLSLYSTRESRRVSFRNETSHDDDLEEQRPLWSGPISSPCLFAVISPDAELIASSGTCDTLVKIWRRLSFEEGLFDYTYLPHRAVLTHAEWKPHPQQRSARRGSGLSGRHEEEPEVLYTIAADGILRIWKTAGAHDPEILVLYTSLDLVQAIPSSPHLTSNSNKVCTSDPRFVFIIPSNEFGDVTSAILAKSQSQTTHSLEHLKEIASNGPDIFVIVDGQGRMSAWGLQSIGHKRRPDTPASREMFHIAHCEDLPLKIPTNTNARVVSWLESDRIQCVAHAFDGSLQWWNGSLESFVSPSAPGPERLAMISELTGHSQCISGIVSSEDRRLILSWSKNGEAIVWEQTNDGQLKKTFKINVPTDVVAASFWGDTNEILFMVDKTLHSYSIRQTRWKIPFELDYKLSESSSFQILGKSLLVIDYAGALLEVSKLSNSLCVEVKNSEYLTDTNGPPIKRAVLVPHRTNRLEFMAVALSEMGQLLIRRLHMTSSRNITPAASEILETGYGKPDLWTANDEIAVLLIKEKKLLVLVDLIEGYVEHEEVLDVLPTHVACFRTTSGQSAAGLGYGTRIDVLCRSHYAHHHKSIWTNHTLVTFEDTGSRLNSLAPGAVGQLLYGFANGLGVQAVDTVGLKSAHRTSHHLPGWHPERFRATLSHHGVTHVLTRMHRLLEKLRFWSEGDDLDDDEEIRIVDDHSFGIDLRDPSAIEEIRDGLLSQLDDKQLPHISKTGQQYLKLIVRTAAYVMLDADGLDANAQLYLFEWKFKILQHEEVYIASKMTSNRDTDDDTDPVVRFAPKMSWREIAFAYHSTTQQPLLDLLVLHYNNKIDWPTASALGITAWLTDVPALRQLFESIGQAAYRSTSPADPIDASLYFLALQKKTALLGLWRIATWHKEQRATLNFLKRDFTQPESKTAAKKNAYALMGKRRFEYAAAFFLLADDATSAVSLLAGQCEDLMLAVAVARLFGEGEHNEVLRALLEDRMLPLGEKEGNRWLVSWCHSVLGARNAAAEALIKPLDGVKRWHEDDPVTIVLYRTLRMQFSKDEYQAVRRSARILRRMGLSLQALDLVQSWTFMHEVKETEAAVKKYVTNGMNGVEAATSSFDFTSFDLPQRPKHDAMLDVRSKQSNGDVKADTLSDQASRQAKAAELLRKMKEKKEGAKKPEAPQARPAPTQFKEPDMNSLLDSFGF